MAKKGICTLCGKGGKLSFEHIPPQCAFNPKDSLMYGLDEWLGRSAEGEMTGGIPQPKGTGIQGLCEPCNNFLGANYVPAVCRFLRGLANAVSDSNRIEEADRSSTMKVVGIKFHQIPTLALVKQAATGESRSISGAPDVHSDPGPPNASEGGAPRSCHAMADIWYFQCRTNL